MTLCQKENMSVKRIRFVHPYLHHEANHVLIEVMKWGNPGLKVEKPLILYVEKHVLTKEMVDIYQGG
jgi:tRNA1(Val) A37 N6-methylase TrmN6